jgi:hypothetical protein
METSADVSRHSAVTNFLVAYLLQKFGRRWCFVYANAFHFCVMLVLGLLGFGKTKGAGWVGGVGLDVTITASSAHSTPFLC